MKHDAAVLFCRARAAELRRPYPGGFPPPCLVQEGMPMLKYATAEACDEVARFLCLQDIMRDGS